MTSTPASPDPEQRRPSRSWTNRTSLVTAAAIAGVLIAGTAAVAANIGILNAADDSAIGDLAATDELLPDPAAGADIETVAVDVPSTPAATPTTPTTVADNVAQQYDIDGTGTVWVMTTTSGIALDHVVAEPGWIPVLSQGDLRSLRVDFLNGDRTIVFTAAIGDDGAVIVDVTEPTTVVGAPAAPAAAPSAGTQSYSDDDDHYEDDDHYSDDHEEHEGADDDD